MYLSDTMTAACDSYVNTHLAPFEMMRYSWCQREPLKLDNGTTLNRQETEDSIFKQTSVYHEDPLQRGEGIPNQKPR
jgi:hypothetical protein